MASGYDLGVVGKGITFDSGGISIKPADEMHVMRYDMSGAAAVIAATSTIARLGLKVNVICVAPCTENLPGGHATKPGDVVTSLSGKTVEVINTDAEGRLVLIDGVTYAEREGAQRIVDVATLTGAIRIALGQHYTGLFGRPRGFVDAVRRAGDAAGERLWPMPLVGRIPRQHQGRGRRPAQQRRPHGQRHQRRRLHRGRRRVVDRVGTPRYRSPAAGRMKIGHTPRRARRGSRCALWSSWHAVWRGNSPCC